MNNGKLKPGQLCWLTWTIPQNIGKVVEVINYLGYTNMYGDVYCVKSRDPLLTETFDMAGNSLNIFKLTHECPVMRKQLIPITPPDDQDALNDANTREIQLNQDV